MASHGYSTRVIAGRELVFDEEGFLVNPEHWSREVAVELAQDSGLEALTDQHWKVILFVRDFYLQQGRSPLHKEIRSSTGITMMEIQRLFPGGIRHGARRLAGLPNPKMC